MQFVAMVPETGKEHIAFLSGVQDEAEQ